MKYPQNLPTVDRIMLVFRDHPNEWLTPQDIANELSETPSEIAAHLCALASENDRIEASVDRTRQRFYRHSTEVSST